MGNVLWTKGKKPVIELTDIAPFVDRPVETLSGGAHQRAWLAMLVAQAPECLLLDEPTSALDVTHQIEVLTLVRQLSRKGGLGVVIVLHGINMAARFCDEIIALHSGGIIARGTPDEIMQESQLQNIYGVPMGILTPPAGGLQSRPSGPVAVAGPANAACPPSSLSCLKRHSPRYQLRLRGDRDISADNIPSAGPESAARWH